MIASGIARRYLVLLCGVIALCMTLGASIEIFLNYNSNVDRVKTIQEIEARNVTGRIRLFLNEIEHGLAAIASTPWSLGLTMQDRANEYARTRRLNPAIRSLTLVDAAGSELLYDSATQDNRQSSGRRIAPFWSSTASTSTVFYSNVDIDRASRAPLVRLAVRDRDNADRYTIAQVDLRFVSDDIGKLQAGRAGYAFVADHTQTVVAHRDAARVGMPLAPWQTQLAQRSRDTKDESGSMSSIGPGAEDVLVFSSAVTMRDPDWSVFVDTPRSEALRPVYAALVRSLVTLSAALILAVLIGAVLARRLTGPILDLQRGAARIGAGDLSARIDVKTGDEIEQLASEFNKMAAQLQEYTAGLEQKVADKTAELAQINRELTAANRHKSEFLANMSHELRTPLNAVIGFSDVLKAQMFGPLNAKQLEYTQDILASGQHLLSLINDILDLSKIEAGRMEPDLVSFDVAAALNNALTLVRERAQRHNVSVQLALDPQLGSWVADERKFKQIVVNLLTNAVKFTHPGGRVLLSAAMEHSALMICVTDTGVGIAQEDLPLIFEAFRQVGQDSESKLEGTGLGLTLVKRLVELHGGSVSVKSELSKGSAFTVVFPKREIPPARLLTT